MIIPFELLIGIILISWFKPVSFDNISTLLTADPDKVDLDIIFEFPTTITFGAVVYSLPPLIIPIDFNVNTFFNSKIVLLSAFGCKVLSGLNSIPWVIAWVLSICPISSVWTDKTAFLPVVVAIEVKICKEDTLKPLFKIPTEYIPPVSVIDLVE